ncbi:hypothetical protein [Peribacillus butanolivorans]|uniref:hypothetical protein n=1 Tax=Peribacillus butanolivorans TaxID=421767 RepID=UPI003809CE65
MGKGQAQQMRSILKKLKIPIQYPILTSPTQRTKETGIIIFGEQNIQVKESLGYIDYLKEKDIDEEQKKIHEDLIHIFETAPFEGYSESIIEISLKKS